MISGLLDACPPFRAFNYAFMMSWYSLAVGSETREKFEAGRNDLLMANCDKFVTARKRTVSRRSVCARLPPFAGLKTAILSYDRFRDSFD